MIGEPVFINSIFKKYLRKMLRILMFKKSLLVYIQNKDKNLTKNSLHIQRERTRRKCSKMLIALYVVQLVFSLHC